MNEREQGRLRRIRQAAALFLLAAVLGYQLRVIWERSEDTPASEPCPPCPPTSIPAPSGGRETQVIPEQIWKIYELIYSLAGKGFIVHVPYPNTLNFIPGVTELDGKVYDLFFNPPELQVLGDVLYMLNEEGISGSEIAQRFGSSKDVRVAVTDRRRHLPYLYPSEGEGLIPFFLPIYDKGVGILIAPEGEVTIVIYTDGNWVEGIREFVP